MQALRLSTPTKFQLWTPIKCAALRIRPLIDTLRTRSRGKVKGLPLFGSGTIWEYWTMRLCSRLGLRPRRFCLCIVWILDFLEVLIILASLKLEVLSIQFYSCSSAFGCIIVEKRAKHQFSLDFNWGWEVHLVSVKCKVPSLLLLWPALRAQFIIECLADLKKNLMKRGLNLLIRHGKPEEIIPSLVQGFAAHTVKRFPCCYYYIILRI